MCQLSEEDIQGSLAVIGARSGIITFKLFSRFCELAFGEIDDNQYAATMQRAFDTVDKAKTVMAVGQVANVVAAQKALLPAD